MHRRSICIDLSQYISSLGELLELLSASKTNVKCLYRRDLQEKHLASHTYLGIACLCDTTQFFYVCSDTKV